jgi:DNA-binding phage protein
MKAAVKLEHVLKDHLADPDKAAKYLTACCEEGPDVLLQAPRDMVEAQAA